MENSPSKKPLRKLVEQETGYNVLISTSAWHSLAKRAGKNDIPLSVVEQVYARGYLSADETSKNSPEQQAFSRVDSFLHGGQAQNLDEDLMEVAVPKGHRHMHIVKSAIKRYESKDNPLKEDVLNEKGVPPLGYTTAKKIIKGARWAHKRYKEAKENSSKGSGEKRVAGALLDTSSRPKRRMFKYEKEARAKAVSKKVREKSIADTHAHYKELSKKTGIPEKKILKGHGSGPLKKAELHRIKKAEGKSSTSHKSDKDVDGTKTWYAPQGKGSGEHWVDRKAKFKHKLGAWAANKLRRTRKKYEQDQ
jgi:hypothetical protein